MDKPDPLNLLAANVPFAEEELSRDDEAKKAELLQALLATPRSNEPHRDTTNSGTVVRPDPLEADPSIDIGQAPGPPVQPVRPRNASRTRSASVAHRMRSARRAGTVAFVAVAAFIGFTLAPFGAGVSTQAAAVKALDGFAGSTSGIVTHEVSSSTLGTPTTTTFTFDGPNAFLDTDFTDAAIIDNVGYAQDQNGWMSSPLYDRNYVLQGWVDGIANPNSLKALLEIADDIDATVNTNSTVYSFTLEADNQDDVMTIIDALPAGLRVSPIGTFRLALEMTTVDGVVDRVDYSYQEIDSDEPRPDELPALETTGTITYRQLGEPQLIEAPNPELVRDAPDYRLVDGETRAYMENLAFLAADDPTLCNTVDFDRNELLGPLTDNRIGELDDMIDCLDDANRQEAARSLEMMLKRQR